MYVCVCMWEYRPKHSYAYAENDDSSGTRYLTDIKSQLEATLKSYEPVFVDDNI